MRVGSATAVLLVATAILTSSCSKSNKSNGDNSDFDDQPLLAQAGILNEPMFLKVNLADAAHQDEPAFIVSLLMKGNSLAVEPSTVGPPWWQYTVTNTPKVNREGDIITYEVGTAKLSSRSEPRHWKEEAVEHFAETISFTVSPSSAIAGSGTSELGPYSVRLIWTNDPRVGHWELDHELTKPFDAISQIEANLEGAGRPFLSELRARIAQAQQRAYDGLKDQITSQTGLEIGPARNLVINKRMQAAYYFPPERFNDHSLADVESACRNAKLPVGHNWRWATRNELNAVLDQHGNLIDTPIHVFWPGLSNANAMVPVNTFHVPNGVATLQDLAAIPPTNSFYWQDTLNLYDNGNGSFTTSSPPSTNTGDSKVGSSFDVRTICIARL